MMTELKSPDFAIRSSQIAKSYRVGLGLRRREALRSVDIEITRGELIGLAGPNGSGKSTWMRLLAGIEAQSSGSLEVLGGSTADAKIRREIGFLPEDAPFPPELGARACLDLLGSLSGLNRELTRTRGDALLARVGLAKEATTSLGKFSRGMLRRFGLAQAWLHSPKLILLDEPTAGLDAEGHEVLRELLKEAREEGTTVILSSHLPGDFGAGCDRLAVMVAGELVQIGPPAELLGLAGCWNINVHGLEAGRIKELEAWLQSAGVTTNSIQATGRELSDLYRPGSAASQ
jgi:ABC-2 type transport system ATP-binding protein